MSEIAGVPWGRRLPRMIGIFLLAGGLAAAAALRMTAGTGGIGGASAAAQEAEGAGGAAPTEEPPPVPGAAPPRLPTTRPATALPPGVLVRIDGNEIPRQQYVDYLQRRLGMDRFLEFVDDYLLEKKAQALGVAVTDEEVAKSVDDVMNNRIERLRGSRERFLAEIEGRFNTLETWRAQQAERLRPRLLLERCILKTRKVTVEDVQAKFAEMYGKDGVLDQVRHLAFIKPKQDHPAGSKDAMQRAKEAYEQLRQRPDGFVEMVRERSEEPQTRRNDGMVPNYRPGVYGPAYDESVRALKAEGDVSPPVDARFAVYIVQLVRRTVTRLDDVAAEIRKQLEAQPPTPKEIHALRQQLRDEAKIES
ncbi:MAG: peptidylprolyl isomerase [Planctomycetes bacterium]|nr:peptidylprolyl isomerase [Planctomycetota bacterium]